MAGTIRGPVEDEEPAAFEGAVDNRLGQLLIMQDRTPGGERGFVGGEDDRAFLQVPLVDDVEEQVGSVQAVGEVADFVDDEDMRLQVV